MNLERIDMPLKIRNKDDIELISRHPNLKWVILEEAYYRNIHAFDPKIPEHIIPNPIQILRQLWKEQGRNLEETYIRHLFKDLFEVFIESEMEGFELRVNYGTYFNEVTDVVGLMGDVYYLKNRKAIKKLCLWRYHDFDPQTIDDTTREFYILPLNSIHNTLGFAFDKKEYISKIITSLQENISKIPSRPNLEIFELPLSLSGFDNNMTATINKVITKFPKVVEIHICPIDIIGTISLQIISEYLEGQNKVFVLWVVDDLYPYYSSLKLPANCKMIKFPFYYDKPKDIYNLDNRIGDLVEDEEK
jgi:hypothetical protein